MTLSQSYSPLPTVELGVPEADSPTPSSLSDRRRRIAWRIWPTEPKELGTGATVELSSYYQRQWQGLCVNGTGTEGGFANCLCA